MDEEHVIGMTTQMARPLPDAISDARTQALSSGLSEQVISPLARQLTQHVRERLTSMTAPRSSTSRRQKPRPRLI